MTSIFGRLLSVALSAVLQLVTLICGAGSPAPAADAFTVNIVCECDGVYQIYYSCYFDDEYYGMGGVSDYDGGVLTADSELHPAFSRAYLDGRADVSGFSIDFSPYGAGDTSEAGTTNRVYIAAEYGGTYTVVISGDRESGYVATLVER